jgi:hypothetical protein
MSEHARHALVHDDPHLLDGQHPPPPHDPRERRLLTSADGWQVRVFGEQDFRYAYFARNSMLHLQLWHVERHVSVLTPSRLTADCWELHSRQTGKRRMGHRVALERSLFAWHRLALPNASTLAGLLFWFVRVPTGEIDTIEIRAFG